MKKSQLTINCCVSRLIMPQQNIIDGWFTQQKFISHCSGGQEVQDKGASSRLYSEASSLGLLEPHRAVCSHDLLVHACSGEESKLSDVSS